MAKDPEKLFEDVIKDDPTCYYPETLAKLENILLLLGHGDYDDSEDKNPYVGADFKAGEYFDNLTQKVYVWKAVKYIIHGLFKEGMLAFDKASQVNPKNKHVYVRKIEALAYYIKHKEPKKYKTQGHPELSKELIKTCDKLLSVDKKNIGAFFQKENHLSLLGRYEEAIECCDMQIKLIQECDDVISLFTGKKVDRLTPDGKPMEVQAWKQQQLIYALKDKAYNFFFMKRHMEEKKCLLEILELEPYDEEALERLHNVEERFAEHRKYPELRPQLYPSDKNDFENKKETSAFCDNCGKSLKPTAKFCGGCGTPRS